MEGNVEQSQPATKNRFKIFFILIGIFIVLGGIFGYRWWVHQSTIVSVENSKINATQVKISAEMPAKISKMLKEENDQVKAGEVVAKLDQTELLNTLHQAQAHYKTLKSKVPQLKLNIKLQRKVHAEKLNQARAKVDEVQQSLTLLEKGPRKEEVEQMEAALSKAKAVLQKVKSDLEQVKNLHQKGVATQDQLENVTTEYKKALAQQKSVAKKLELLQKGTRKEKVNIAKNKLEAARANLNLAKAEVMKIQIKEQELVTLKNQLQEAKKKINSIKDKLNDTTVKTPMNGTIIKKYLEPGSFTSPGQPIYAIANLKDTWVESNVEETDIHKVKVGQKVDVYVDAYPDNVFSGQVVRIGKAANSNFNLFPSTNTSGDYTKVVQRIPVKITVDKEGYIFRPGMNVVVDIHIAKNEQGGEISRKVD
ncbi:MULTISPECIES: HlyD family secretion protein [unclassified Candidatus Frackibacter]|uniref:HlyD family secretion protein n=1 Tax=unclassified Candidatus Frackibacter TaxID=2648818 RepID=UPI000791F04F|nr:MULTISPECIES: HlyD family secretion protein [unclassified Candidatus Frackibacter]KXS45123.1 MAG: multidrug resistance protein A [Candidatus Frackibacter sp. T328-2]SDC47387.1 Multidrug resistance efflux pump [Candidatus Frackibacter sp. WG11]SEM81290.1 Multidrug resistance efflux pump [Candidatus Frackibacter sp. WG12]SFL72753.1 Multidrug resistance efflux pump [Candidatus Frackibacter sp. WG13]